jgi:hypothetical protein
MLLENKKLGREQLARDNDRFIRHQAFELLKPRIAIKGLDFCSAFFKMHRQGREKMFISSKISKYKRQGIGRRARALLYIVRTIIFLNALAGIIFRHGKVLHRHRLAIITL